MLRRRTSNRDRLFPTSPRDRGVTFVELLVSIVLLGLVGVAVLVATAAALTGARTSDEIAKSQAAIAEVADFMTDTEPENVTYLDCASVAPADIEAAYQQDVDDFFGPGVVEVEDVAFWNGSDFAGCTFGAGERLQQVTLRTVVNESPRSVVVVKRPVDVPTVGVGTPETIPPYTGGSGQASVTLTDWMVTWP